MPDTPIPSSLARIAMRALPARLLQRMINVLFCRMQNNHPRLFDNLTRLDKTVLLVEPNDVPHRFVLRFGQQEAALEICAEEQPFCTARIAGKLGALLELLEGRVDGDMLFFARDIEISGNTSAVVALRNTLDREEIDVLKDASSVFGPFAQPAREAFLAADAISRHIGRRMIQNGNKRNGSTA